MIVTKGRKRYVECNTYKDLEGAFIKVYESKGLHFLPFKSYTNVVDIFDYFLSLDSISAWSLEIEFNRWKKGNGWRTVGVLQVQYYTLRGYSAEYASEAIKAQQVARSNTNKAARIEKCVKTKRSNGGYSKAVQGRGREFYSNKGCSDEEVEGIIEARNVKWFRSMDIARDKDPTIDKRKGKTRDQLIDKWGEERANEIIASRLNVRISKPEKDIASMLGPDWAPQYYINADRFYVYDVVNIDKKVIIEFNGDFWHANPDLFDSDWVNPVTKKTGKEIWNHDKIKREVAESRGFQVVYIWESEYNKTEDKRLLIYEKLRSYI